MDNNSVASIDSAKVELAGTLNIVGDAAIFAIPLGLFIWSFNKSISYYRDNSTKDIELEDLYDSEMYSKAVIPLYKNLNTHLANSLEPGEDLSFTDYEDQKHSLLEEYDYSQIAGVVGFAEAIEQIEESQAGRKEVKKIRSRNRNLLIATTIFSILSMAGAFSYYSIPSYAGIAIIINIATLLFAIISAGLFYYYSLRLDSIQNEKR